MLERLRGLGNGWDGYDGKAITAEACDAADAILTLCKAATATPCSHGGVQVEAYAAGWEVEIEFGPGGDLMSWSLDRAPLSLNEEVPDDDA